MERRKTFVYVNSLIVIIAEGLAGNQEQKKKLVLIVKGMVKFVVQYKLFLALYLYRWWRSARNLDRLTICSEK